MASIDQLLQQSVNPFDPATFKPGNFWQEVQASEFTIDSIHQGALTQIEATLDQVAQDHATRTLLLHGDSGAGKSHLLGRLKRTLNPKAFFVYIGPWPDSEFIWRHTLRQTVDSLVQVPEGQAESQLLLWLKNLSVFQHRSLIDRLLGDRKAFVRQLRDTYPKDIYRANEFFGVLHALLDSEHRVMACDWLRGDDLETGDRKALGVRRSIDSENAAQKILANFGRISTQTQPIVLCFDNLDGIPRLANGVLDLQALLNVNSTLHNEKLHNFLVIISVITNTWRENSKRVQPADKARIDLSVPLKLITLDQATSLWQARLLPIHQQAKVSPRNQIYPLDRETLEQKFPGGKTHPRAVLELGRRLILQHKTGKAVPDDLAAAFQLIWLQEFQRTAEGIDRIRQFSSPELAQMLQEACAALQAKDIRSRFLPSPTYSIYSFSYQRSRKKQRIGVVWMEDPNSTSVFYVMGACQKVVALELCDQLQLIRAEPLAKRRNQGVQLYQQIFSNTQHQHLIPTLKSVHCLATYYALVTAARSMDLVIGGKTLTVEELQALARETGILQDCQLLRDLEMVPRRRAKGKTSAQSAKTTANDRMLSDAKTFLTNFITTHRCLGRQILMQTAIAQYPGLKPTQITKLIQSLCREKKVRILDPTASPETQIIALSNVE